MSEILCKDIAIRDSGLIFNPRTGESFLTNPMGIGIINHLREGRSNHEIGLLLTEEFNVEFETAERDILDFLSLLKHFQLISPNNSKQYISGFSDQARAFPH